MSGDRPLDTSLPPKIQVRAVRFRVRRPAYAEMAKVVVLPSGGLKVAGKTLFPIGISLPPPPGARRRAAATAWRSSPRPA